MTQLQQAAADALAVQDACNLSGVAHSFLKAVQAVNEEVSGTEERNNHPIIRLFVDKLASLCGMQGATLEYHLEADAACREIAKGTE